MNERIRELAERAGSTHKQSLGVYQFYSHELEEFVQLIVRECGQVLVDNTPVVDLVEDWDKGYDRAMNDCIHHIYEHFGVE